MNEVSKLMADAQQQLDEHIAWLVSEILKIPVPTDDVEKHNVMLKGGVSTEGDKKILAEQASMIKLRMSRADGDTISILWEYPDELSKFLRSTAAPEHLRASIADGHVVDMNQPGHGVKRAL